MEIPKSSYSIPIEDKKELLRQAIKSYKNIYLLLRIAGISLLAFVIVYLILIFFGMLGIYKPLSEDWKVGDKVAADSSGRLIAFPVLNTKDTSLSILTSMDSGQHFKQSGGPWKLQYDYGVGNINSITVAPDNKSIVAIGENSVFIKGANADSFTCINLTKLDRYAFLGGLCFMPGTDSVFIYDYNGNIFCFNYKRYDSFAMTRLQGINRISSMSISKRKEIAAISFYDVYINNHFTEFTKYAVTYYRNDISLKLYIDSLRKAENLKQSLPDTTVISTDTTSFLPADTTHFDTIKK